MLVPKKFLLTSITAGFLFLSSFYFNNGERQTSEMSGNSRSIALKETQIKNISDSTVLIKREFQYGSGVIIAKVKTRNKQIYTYYVLTARHSVDKTDRSKIKFLDTDYELAKFCNKNQTKKRNIPQQLTCTSFLYNIYTKDGKKHSIDYDSIVKFSKKLDLALVRFQSKNEYRVASLASKQQIKPGYTIYLSGYRGCDRPDLNMTNKYELTTGKIKKVEKSGNLLYSNFTIGGMSGGGIFNQQGKLIAIHQRANSTKQYDRQKCPALESQFNNLGNNWGTTVSQFLEQKDIPLEVKRNYKECTGLPATNSYCSID